MHFDTSRPRHPIEFRYILCYILAYPYGASYRDFIFSRVGKSCIGSC